jgi:prepilin-type N-terminal cleavage/methylation domain-containing protein
MFFESCEVVKVENRQTGFTLIELLVVISILGILAGLSVPALKNLGKSNANVGASRQFLDDLGHARQLAIANHTTVYMVFVPTNFFTLNNVLGHNVVVDLNNAAYIPLAADRLTALTVLTNLLDKQLSGYTFASHGRLGDQPGNHQWHYLAPWQNLPDGTLIEARKFIAPGNVISSQGQPLLSFWNSDYPHSDQNRLYSFYTNAVPFPTEASPLVNMPSVAFNYLGQLTFDGVNLSSRDEYIPLTHGSVGFAYDPATKMPVIPAQPLAASDISENPYGNTTNISYNVVHIDALTGRAVLEFHKIGP